MGKVKIEKEKEEKEKHEPERNFSSIKNRIKRQQLYAKYKKEKLKAKHKERENKQKDKNRVKQLPKTIENTRVRNDNIVVHDEEDILNEEMDEMAAYFKKEVRPKLVITTCQNPHEKTILFCRELMQTVPNSDFKWRNRSSIKKMVKEATEREFTDLIIVNEDRRQPSGLLHIHLPNGPTSYYRVRNYVPCEKISNAAEWSSHYPEVIVKNFTTEVGNTVARMFHSLFYQDPQFKGRRVVTFQNQRDYIFFRHHRYEFKDNGKRAALQEIGPRFTLRLQYLQNGTFDTKFGEFEWVPKQDDQRKDRRKFTL